MAREFSKSFYRSKEWQKVRAYALMRDRYLCQMCGMPAQEVHHIIHLSPKNIGDITITLNPDNLVCLCKDCHFAQHEADKKEGRKKRASKNRVDCSEQYVFDDNGYLMPI